MNPWDIFAIVLCIAVISLVGFMIPILIQLKELLKIGETTLNNFEKEIEPVIHNVEGITGNFQGITGVANTFINRNRGNEPGFIDNIKVSVKEGTDVIIHHYMPLISKESDRYIRAFKIGLKVAIKKYKSSRKNGFMKVKNHVKSSASFYHSPVAEDIVIVDHHIIKR